MHIYSLTKCIRMKVVIVYLLLIAGSIYGLSAQDKPSGLLTDLLSGPGVHAAQVPLVVLSEFPSFSWIVPGKKQETLQTAYRILVSDDEAPLRADRGNIWDSGKVIDSSSVAIIFKGKPLKPQSTYFWKVKVFTNQDGESSWSDIKLFTTGAALDGYRSSAERLVKSRQTPIAISSGNTKYQSFDFKKDGFGQLSLRLSSNTGRDTVMVDMGELLIDKKVNEKPPGTIRYRRQSLALKKGTHWYKVAIEPDKRNTGPAAVKMPEYIGEVLPFRYVGIEGYPAKLKVEDVVRYLVHYPFDDQAAYFKSSNDTLNQVWELSKYTIKATSFAGIYVDGDRERIPYEADALINQLGHYGTDRSYAMARTSSEYLLQKPTWPTEWIMQALIIAWSDYLYTGDSRSLKANYKILKNRTLMQLVDKSGLISTTTGLQTPEFAASINFNGKIRDIVDWPTSETDGFKFSDYNAVTNAFHYRALVIMEQIAILLGNKKDADIYRLAHQRLKLTFNQVFFNKETGLYQDGDTTEHSSMHANMFAVDFGLVPEQHMEKVLKFIKSRGMASSVYGSQFLLESLYTAGADDYALSLLCSGDIRSWYNMIRVGSTLTLEAWDNKFKPNQDWNHAWGAAPANILPRKLMGVEPLTPGFGKVAIKPQVGNLSYAEALVPTIRGGVKVIVRNTLKEYVLKVEIPANMKAAVYLPIREGARSISCNGKKLKVAGGEGKLFREPVEILSGSYTFSMISK